MFRELFSESISKRRTFLAGTALTLTIAPSLRYAFAADTVDKSAKTVSPPVGKKILISCKLSMISGDVGDRKLTLAERLRVAADAGFDGVDFDEAGKFSENEARAAVDESRVYAHNAINHEHWQKRLTSPDAEERKAGNSNIEHCLRVAHAIGGSGVLIVIGNGSKDGSEADCEARAREEIKKLLPLAASLGQPILIENVWNYLHYDHDAPAEQTPDRFIRFIDSFNSPWVGMYYDIGNHWKYGQPKAWIKAFGHRVFKLDIKGFSRKKDKFVDICSDDDDVPWKEVQQALAEIDFSGWATAEVGGGDLERLTIVRKQMEKALGIPA